MRFLKTSIHIIGWPFRKTWGFIKRFKYHLAACCLIVFLIWLNCLPEKIFDDPTCTVLTDADGNILGARIADDGQWRFPPRTKVPQKFEKAIIQFEDRDFYDHMGFSFKAFARAIKQNVSAGEVVSGGSTISMQTIRISRKGKSRSLGEKVVEVFQATRMETVYSKKEILAMYASNAPMGGNVVGLDAAAWRYFGRRAEDLSWAETCVLAILPNAPGLIHPGRNRDELLAKRNRLLDRLHAVGELDDIELDLAKAEPIPDAPPDLPNIAPHLMDRIIASGKKGEWVKSTVRGPLQQEVARLVEFHHKHLAENEIHNAAVLIMEVQTGEIRAYVGNTSGDDPEHGNAVDVIPARRSTGSILKPLLYAGMLHHGEIMPHELVQDVPTIIAGYTPKNYDGKYDGAVPASRALSRSLNIPIVNMLQDYGVKKFHSQLNRMGLTTIDRPSSHYGLTLVLGGAETCLWDLCAVYGNMARTLKSNQSKTRYVTPSYLAEVPVENRYTQNMLLSPASIWSTFKAMEEVARPNAEAGWEEFSSSQRIAWKTGTSFGFRDAWAIGVTPEYVVGVWVGNADGEGRPGLVGIQAAAPLLFDVFNLLPDCDWFTQPHWGMETIAVCRHSGCRASGHCTHVDHVAVPSGCLNTTACPYHKPVHLDHTGEYRVNSSCEQVSDMRTKNWFILPPIVERYYRSKNPSYKTLPPYKDECAGSEDAEPMAIIYPKTHSKIYIPRKLDGTLSKTVFEASHREQTTKVYWHLDEKYLGETKRMHQIELVPTPGNHTLTLVDEMGNEVVRRFEVIGRE